MAEFISQNLMLVALFVISGIMVLWPTLAKLSGSVREIGTLEATRLMNTGNALVLDIRDNAEYSGGHLPRAKNIPLPELGKREGEITKFKDKPVIITCKSGGRAAAAAKQLKQLGFSDVYQLQGGVSAWQQASLPIER